MRVFTYGSLMFDEIWSLVVRGKYLSEAAYVKGFERRAINAVSYPALIPVKDSTRCVEGYLYHDVSPQDLRRLDVFEGREYQRHQHIAYTAKGKEVPCAVYVWCPAFNSRLSKKPWDVDMFCRQGLKGMIKEITNSN